MKAFISTIKTTTEKEQIAYVGFGLGNHQMFYGLGMEDADLKKDVAAFVALSPCAVPSNPPFTKDEEGNFVKWTLEDLRDGLVANVDVCPNAFGPGFENWSDVYYDSIGTLAPAMY